MSSRRRSRSRDRKNVSNSKLRMDNNTPAPRISGRDPSLPAGRRREIDNVMKKARAQNSPTSSAIWEKKLLEVEAKDSNRWRHSGYKSLYLDGGSSRSRSRSRSFSSTRRGGGGTTLSPRGRSPRSPPLRARSPRSPLPRGRSPRSPSNKKASSPMAYRSARPRTPPSPKKGGRCNRRSASASSLSSCSDDSCSVCSPKHRRRSRSRSFSPVPSRPSNSSATRKQALSSRPTTSRPRPPSPTPPPPPPRRLPRPVTPPVAKRLPRPSSSDRPTDPRTRPPPPRLSSPKTSQKVSAKMTGKQPLLTRIKKEGAPRKKRPGSPAAGESSGSDDSGASIHGPVVATTTMTLSERFGKIAQWSADRERRDIENMRITKTGSNMKVMVEEDDYLYGSPPRRYSISPVPQGPYPDELLSAGQSRLAAWDDVRVRYQYYKDLGYLRDLTLDDYVKWEEWWYKYQDWLANERHYEHWLATHGSSGSRRRKKRLPASQRLGT
ncbi:hypothetical protein ABEB36_000058 [Hypothenemus hampei]|uniref:Serine/arginine repetitive matrix protein 1 n=1 Tax=Hypothenemus hampei TaxID=57062 RepID=A0ABD1FAL8_HYPHA